ncbi:hypothetical protein [Pseudemcibacter aquimaris]|uniref:hypothetical protein n=1 Tax=Pseudemcibacter aquimaris TaxID=2857064 RepID=UPI0020138FC7|nr:hypothetical protein [Pseudemcibacter aquimaris]MCC3860383.1 hypothetical protein [Pseudemcibacter aquimaris]WDU57709.1 hypothetical protein KW060_10930 [Pseudemcibacter aquimaris]
MKIRSLKSASSLLAMSLMMTASPSFAQEMPSQAEMWEMIKRQQAQIEALQKKLGETEQVVAETNEKVEETEQALEATVVAMEEGMVAAPAATGAPVTNNAGLSTMGPRRTGRFTFPTGTSVGGYGELHWNGGNADQIDFHRYVMFFNHEFNDRIRLFSEVEIEHSLAGDGKPGEVEMEQAFIEIDVTDNSYVDIGLQLVPVGILNETHEPNTFYGVERNNVEKNIIPTTWWEAGIKYTQNVGDNLRFEAMLHSGLETPIDSFKIRSGRQKVAEANWKNAAYTGRMTWMPASGVILAATLQYQSDLTQSSITPTSATLFETHADIKRMISDKNEFGLRALYAQWNLNSDEAELMGKDIQRGWYIEPSLRHHINADQSIGFFVRYSMWDNTAGSDIDTANKQTSFGVNYWPHQRVVLKADYQIDNYANVDSEDNRFNLGVGFQF